MIWLVEQRERPVHLIVVCPDQSGFQHPHPTVQIDGTRMAGMTYPQLAEDQRGFVAYTRLGGHKPG